MSIKDSKKLLDDFEGMFKKAREARLEFEREWYLNLAFYFGRQWVQWVKAGDAEFSRLIEPPLPPWRVRLVINKIKPIIRKELAKINQERPRGFVVPSSSDDADLAAAKAGDSIYEHVTTQDLNLSNIMWRASFWMVMCGTGFIKDWYDETEYDSAGMQGRIKGEPLSPFHLLAPDMEEPELDNQPYIIHAMGKDPEWIELRLGKKLQPDSDSAGGGLLENKFLNALGIKSTSHRKKVMVKEIWIQPNSKYKNGLVAMWANNEILHVTEGMPYAHGEYPFTKIDHIPTGRFYGQSTIVDLIPLQKEYNRARSQIIESRNRMSKPQLSAAKGSIDARKITTEPGLVVFYQPGFQPPQPIPLQGLPNYVLEEVDRTQRDMDDISSQHEVSKGRTPPGVEAATAIAYLQEQDDTVIAHTTDSVESAHQRIGKHLLSYVGQFWDAQRVIRVVGKNSFYESYIFKGSDLRGNTDFKVVPGSSAPRSRAAKQAMIMELMKLGLIPPDRALQYLEMAETSKLFEEMQIDVRQAQRENLKISSGGFLMNPNEPSMQVPVNVWDEHAAHIQEHDAYRKRQEFEQLDERIKQYFQMHVDTHKMAMAMEMGMPMPEGDPRLTGMAKGTLQLPAGPGDTQGQEEGQQPPQQEQLPMEVPQ